MGGSLRHGRVVVAAGELQSGGPDRGHSGPRNTPSALSLFCQCFILWITRTIVQSHLTRPNEQL